MQEKIKKMLDKDFKTLSSHLIKDNNQDLLAIVIEAIVKAINGEVPYLDAMHDMCRAHPELSRQFEVKDAMSEIILLIKGRHYAIEEAYETEKEVDPVAYRMNLTKEIVDNLKTTFSQFISSDSNDTNGYSIIIRDTYLASQFDNLQLLKVEAIGDHNENI